MTKIEIENAIHNAITMLASLRITSGDVVDELKAAEEHLGRSGVQVKMNRDEWACCACHAVNSTVDGECQFCDCDGLECKRDNCSGPDHGQKAIDRILRDGKPKA